MKRDILVIGQDEHDVRLAGVDRLCGDRAGVRAESESESGEHDGPEPRNGYKEWHGRSIT